MDQGPLQLGHQPRLDHPRDAVHVAIIPVLAGEHLLPGDRVGLRDSKAFRASEQGLGVVDPFLEGGVEPGQSFWLLLHPGTITSLRHQWSHPAFPLPRGEDDTVTASEAWLREHAEQYRIDYAELLAGAISGEGATFGDLDGPEWTRTEQFWYHVSVLTGRQFSPAHIENTFFYCSC